MRGVAHGRAAAEHGDCAREVRRAVGQPRELALHAAGDLLRPERAQPGGDVVGRGDLLGRELTDERAEQERVPGGDGMTRVREARVRRREALAHERLRCGRAQRARTQRALRRGGEQLREQVRLGRGLARAHRADDAEPQFLQTAGELRQPPQRRRVGPVDVVDEEHGRRPVREVGGQVLQPVRRGMHRVPGERRLGGIGMQHPPREPRGAGRQLAPARPSLQRGEELTGDAPRRVLLERAGARAQHRRPLRLRTAARGGEEARLADPGGALHHDDATRSGSYLLEPIGERRELGIAIQQCIAHASTVRRTPARVHLRAKDRGPVHDAPRTPRRGP